MKKEKPFRRYMYGLVAALFLSGFGLTTAQNTKLVFEETLKNITKTSTTAISKFDNSFDNSGWTGSYVYPQATGMVKLSSSKAAGKLTSPTIDLSDNEGKFTLVFKVASYNNDNTAVSVTVGSETKSISEWDKSGISNPSSTNELQEVTLDFTNGTKTTQIIFASPAAGKRFFVGDLRIYQGQDAPVCGIVSDVKAELSSYNTVKLSWTAPEQAPANGYKVSINKKADNAEVVKDATVAAGTTEYTCNTLTENTEYTYSIVSVCGEGDESQAVTGTFKTKAAICPQASNINAVTTSAFTLTWQDATANETATEVILAPEKYHIKITTAADAATAVKDEDINTGVQTYAYTDPTAGTEYTYTFHSVCADNKTSTPKTDNFTPVAADAKTLNVSLSGSQENSKYTGAITFTFAANNFTLGTDGKVKYSIIGDKQEIEETLTAENSVTHDLLSGDYRAEFELVDMAGNSLDPKVSDEVVFTVDLPDVAAPTFSLAEQTAAFTEAQTLTLSCGTEGAKIYYAIGEADFTEYKEAINLDKSGTFTIRAFAAKEKMDTSATVSKTYTLKLPLHVDGIVVFEENFTKFTSAASQNIAGTLNEYTTVSGWKGANVYSSSGTAKLGSGSATGYLQLPELELMESFSIYFKAEGWSTTENQLKVSVNGVQCGDIITIPVGEMGEIKVDYAGGSTIKSTGSMKAVIKIETTEKRCRYLDDIKIYQADSTPKPQPVCNAVSNVRPKPGYGNVVFSWDQTTPAPALGFAVEIFTADTLTSVSKDTTQAYTLLVDDLAEGEMYVYSITSLCATDLSSEAVMGTVTTLKKGVPHITIENPGEGREYVSSTVTFNYRVEEFTLGTSESDSGFVKYTITGERLTAPISDTCTRLSFTREFDFSGNYKVDFSLVDKAMNTVEAANKVSRNFIVNLPDVAAPVFAPEATALDTVTNVTLSCTTEGATIYYSLNDADFTAYAQPIKLDTNGTYKFKAFAVKAKMDTSAEVSKTYTLTLPVKPVEIVGDIVFEEHFDKVPSGTGEISSDINKYTTVPGWKAVKVYQQTGGGIIKMGTGNALGSIQTPAIDLTANEGKYIVSFYAQAWFKDQNSIRLIAGNDTVDATGLVNNATTNNISADKLSLKHYAFAFENGTTDTKIKFEAKQASNNRFFLDSVRIYQVLPDVPRLSVSPDMFEMNTVQGTPVSSKITVKGHKLESDVTISVLSEANNFSVSAATLTKEAVMAENGAEFSITFNGSVAKDSAMIELTSGVLQDTVWVRALAATVTEVNNIAALRAGTQGSLYKIKGEVLLTAQDANRNSKWIEDESGAILIDDNSGLVTTSYKVGDGITGVYGKLDNYFGQLQLVITGNLPEASSHNNVLEPETVTIAALNENMEKYCSRLVRINGLTLKDPSGQWKGNTDNAATKGEDEINIRTFVRNGDFVGTDKPKGEFDLIAIVGVYKKNESTDMMVQVSPRTTEDIIASGVEPEKDTVKTPVFTPASGSTIAMGSIITISCATDGAKIYYTTDGEEPTTQTNLYVDGIKMTEKTMAIQAIAVKEGMINSEIAIATYTASNVAIEATDNLQASIYPNPNDGSFFVEVAEDVRMEIFTLSGMSLRTLELAAGKTEINLPQSGIYFIRLSNAQATIVKRVVVR